MLTDPLELLQTSMELYGTLRAPMGYYELPWTHMHPYGTLWAPMGSDGLTICFQGQSNDRDLPVAEKNRQNPGAVPCTLRLCTGACESKTFRCPISPEQ